MAKRTVYTGGTFDLFHAGHVNFLRQCKKIAGRKGWVIVVLNTDEFITKYKGSPPIHSYEQRASILYGCSYVNFVYPNTGGADSKPAIEQINPDFIVVGDDWACKDYYAQMQFTQEWLDKKDITLIYVPYTKDISTTELKRRILQS
jgi:glycerol-3-phosphate cytidylyltransferase